MVVVGGGIAGVTVAERLSAALAAQLADGVISVELLDDGAQPGGKLRTTPFAGRPAVDEGADAFLTRVPHASDLAARLGLDRSLTSPATGSAFVWHGRLHPIPDGLALGLPGRVLPLVTSRLLSVRGIARAAVEPLLPRRPDGDSVGRLVRSRFGTEVHERLVDPLVGSIYATDTDRFSLAMVPQLASLARRRSLLLAARSARSTSAPTGPVFAAPVAGMQQLAIAAAERAAAAGTTVVSGRTVHTVAADGPRWRVDDEPVDAVVLATPAATTAPLIAEAAPDLAVRLGAMDHADVAIVTLAVDGEWPAALRAHSGYLVPKPDQGLVTAVSFGSQKWAHWRGEGEVLRVSIGRDGRPLGDRDDAALVAAAVDEVGGHLGLDLQPTDVRVTRWPRSFPQYRPGHLGWLAGVDGATPPGVFLTGASYRGIGVPACIADAERTADAVLAYLAAGGRDPLGPSPHVHLHRDTLAP